MNTIVDWISGVVSALTATLLELRMSHAGRMPQDWRAGLFIAKMR
jgi:hypothetical protein